mmetsp:Transcript_42522/g.109311  ORF Transcript_42522/g.109311 Transcript_42522/m.109311 type:complete len:155 (+) Transcript_42522:2297-2761(+)
MPSLSISCFFCGCAQHGEFQDEPYPLFNDIVFPSQGFSAKEIPLSQARSSSVNGDEEGGRRSPRSSAHSNRSSLRRQDSISAMLRKQRSTRYGAGSDIEVGGDEELRRSTANESGRRLTRKARADSLRVRSLLQFTHIKNQVGAPNMLSHYTHK